MDLCAIPSLNFEFPGPDVECDKKCANGGWCNSEKICQCPEGYMGQHCNTALCYPACMNNGTCTAPGVCSCPTGYQGRHCEGGNFLIFHFIINLLFYTNLKKSRFVSKAQFERKTHFNSNVQNFIFRC